ncbi:hypothetical protein GO001_12710 [Streptomyces sp. NRRL B-1677]|uniref:Uncharacterized protein n=1 Tax=Streptomyces klenkii TaxID=1420899 RepID=A0A3B0BTQ5_9ACTN|nr:MULTISPECIES: DUF6415 family natural product biosynthesis protein [Streptomyces]MBF6046081.1 hypothetical protein [Streptomyces sp. NRRL B-1677]RKN76312.1 hypothetical protein D7231_04710 [Streptomyces klenkii]
MNRTSAQHTARLTTMMTGDTRPLDLVTIRATVRRALQERATGPGPAEAEELTRTLRGHMEAMIAEARFRVDQLDRGTVQWDRSQALIDQVCGDLEHDGDHAAVSATAYLEVLARGAGFLVTSLDG